ncbi:MAG: excinuclease ABC subunit UvrC [bacterium]
MIDFDFTKIPQTNGVYRFYDKGEKVLYIGKAINLQSRVRSYFTSRHEDRPVLISMIPLISDIKVIETENEVESLILEANLIKKYRPYYNVDLKDDKRYIWIYIDTYSKYPKIIKTREKGKKGRYFGPYPDGRPTNRILKYLRRLYPYADCGLQFFPEKKSKQISKKRICLYYHLGQCTGPCDNLITPEQYKKNIKEIISILEGKKKRHVSTLEKKMLDYSSLENFENAAVLRDKIEDLKYLSQRIDISYGDTEEYFIKMKKDRDVAGISEIFSYYDKKRTQPSLARIECYDISNISGKNAYGSMTVSKGPEILISNYRAFKIKGRSDPNDVRMIKEVLTRRFKHVENSVDESLSALPDIVLIDGGKGQLSGVPEEILEKSIVVGISKGKRLKRSGLPAKDEFWIKKKDGTVSKIRIDNPFIFTYLRDEAHRFAIKHHRNSRKIEQKHSVLDNIEGVGEERRKQLLRKFGSLKGIQGASVKEINGVMNNLKVAEKIFKALKKSSSPR